VTWAPVVLLVFVSNPNVVIAKFGSANTSAKALEGDREVLMRLCQAAADNWNAGVGPSGGVIKPVTCQVVR
jgi:hypothetical protein